MSASQVLWAARSGGGHVTLSADEVPTDAAAAYVVQRGITELCGSALVGWKIGATAQAAMDLLGVSEPFFGPLYEQCFHVSGDEVPIRAEHGAGIETEFVVGLKADLPVRSQPYTVADVEAAIDWVAPGVEIIGARLACGLAGAGNSVLADGGANMDFVLGPKSSDWRQFDLTSHAAALSINDKEVARGHSGMLLFGDTIGAVVWLANCAHTAPRGLKAGDVITTGSCTGVIPIAVGDSARADFGSMGSVNARFMAA
jgi:2-keto-4-pentenoate hydratase